jgi:hypothetical protein
MPSRYCAWCEQSFEGRVAAVEDHGVGYHAACYTLREAFLQEWARPIGHSVDDDPWGRMV